VIILWIYDSGARILLIGGGLGLGRVDFDAALEMSAVLDADARGGNIADHGAIGFDVNAVASVEIADDFTVDHYFTSANFGIEHGVWTYGELMAVQRDGAVHFAVNLQVISAGELTLDTKAGAQAS